jgi:signal recognition particle subunit SRP14
MVLMSNDAFLTGLTKLFQSAKTSGTVWLTMKKYDGRTKPRPRKNKKEGVSSNKGSAFVEHEENYCLLRATNGKKKISTMVMDR